MNRVKLGVFVAAVVGLTVVSARSRSLALAAQAVQGADARLSAAQAQLGTGLALFESRAAAVAALAAEDAGLAQALAPAPAPKVLPRKPVKGKKSPPPPPVKSDEEVRERAAEAAARNAVGRAEKALGFELPPLSFYAAADRAGIARKLKAGAEGSQREVLSFMADAARGRARRGFAQVNDGLWYGVAVPVADAGALVLFVPLDEAWARSIQAGAGVDVTLAAGLPKAVTTLAPAGAKAVVDAALAAKGSAVGAGRAGRIDAGFALPFPVPPLPLLFARAPALRAVAVPLTGVEGGHAVLSTPVGPLLAGAVQAEWSGLALALGAIVMGVLVGLLIHGEAPPQVPADLLAAAARIERGDFGARVPTMAGKYGTVAAALNRAADAASHVAAAVQTPDSTGQFFGRAPTHPEGGVPQAFELKASPPASGLPPAPAEATPQAFSTTSRMDGAGLAGFGQPLGDEPLSEAQEEERHWEQIFDEFLRVREECGEPSDGLTFDRFKVKLQKNKETLVQKYGCRTVRFQVYVKEGKAALKATPVK